MTLRERAGIAIIYQELALVPEMMVYENIFLGNEISNGPIVNWNETIRRATEALKKVRLEVNPAVKVKDLGVGKQQLVEIAKALSREEAEGLRQETGAETGSALLH